MTLKWNVVFITGNVLEKAVVQVIDYGSEMVIEVIGYPEDSCIQFSFWLCLVPP